MHRTPQHTPDPSHSAPDRRSFSHTAPPLLALCAVYSTAQPALPPALRCPPHAARARDTSVCVPLPSAPLFAQRRALSRGMHWPCRARAPRSAPVRARCARTHLQRGWARRGAAHAAAAARRTRARALPRRAAPAVHALSCGCGLLTVRSRCSAALRCVLSRAPWSQHPCTSALTTLLVRSKRASGAERSGRTAEASGACALLCADA
jgi:hypothetical protein